MKATTTRANGHARTHTYNLNKDYKKIQSALTGAQKNVKKKARQIWGESLDNIKERSTEAQDIVSDYINEQPFKTIGIIALCSFILGFLFRK